MTIRYGQDIALLVVFFMLLPLAGQVLAATSGSVTPPYSDISRSAANGCYYTWDLNGFPKGYYCIYGTTSDLYFHAYADQGEYANPAGPDTVSSYSGSVLFDQNQGDGVALSSDGSAVSMATYLTGQGPVSANFACSSGVCSADAYFNVDWTYTWYNSGCPCYQTQIFTGTIWDVDHQGYGETYSCSGCQYVLAVKNAPAFWVGGGASSAAWADSGYSAWAWLTSQDPQSHFGTSNYLYVPQISAASWTVSLSASNTHPSVGQSITLTATTSSDVGSWPYYINIIDQTSGALVAVCSSGTSCSAQVSESSATTQSYLACVGGYGYCSSSSIVTSNQVTVSWGGGGGGSLAIDGAQVSCGVHGTSCTTGTLTTSHANDVYIIYCFECNTPTDSQGITVTPYTSANGKLYEYYFTWSSSGSISATCPGFNGVYTLCAMFAVSGAPSQIFDPNNSVPCTGSSNSCSISTSNANDVILGFCFSSYSSNNACASAGSGYTPFGATTPGNTYTMNAEYLFVSTIQSNRAVNWGGSNGQAVIGEAIQ